MFTNYGSSFGQNDVTKTGLSPKLFVAPEFFFQTNLKAPMPLVGLRGSVIFNTTEIELSFAYFTKLFETRNANPTNSYQSILYTYHYILPGTHIHQKNFR